MGPLTALNSTGAGAAEEADGGAEDLRRAEAAGLGHHGKVGTLTPEQAPPGHTGLHLAPQEYAVCPQRATRGDGDVATGQDERTELLAARQAARRAAQELAQGSAGG